MARIASKEKWVMSPAVSSTPLALSTSVPGPSTCQPASGESNSLSDSGRESSPDFSESTVVT